MAAEEGVSQPDGAQGISRKGWPLGQADLIRQSQEGGHANCVQRAWGRVGRVEGGLPQSWLKPAGLLV